MRVEVPGLRTAFSLGALLLVTGVVCGAQGAMLAVENVSYNEDGSVCFPIRLVAGSNEQVAALQFDLRFRADLLTLEGSTAATPGSAARAAEKSVNAACTKPGTLRVIVAGLNQNVMNDGEVTVVLFGCPGTREQAVPSPTLENVLVSDPRGRAIPVEQSTAALSAAPPGKADLAATTRERTDEPWRRPFILALLALVVAVGWRFRGSFRAQKKQGTPP